MHLAFSLGIGVFFMLIHVFLHLIMTTNLGFVYRKCFRQFKHDRLVPALAHRPTDFLQTV